MKTEIGVVGAASEKQTRFPVLARGAEHLVIGHLMRRNIMAYPAPALNEGYDLICINPNLRKRTRRFLRVQVKSRMATDAGGFPIKGRSIRAFDYLILVLMNVGYHYRRRHGQRDGARAPELFTFPSSWIRAHLNTRSSWEKIVLSPRERIHLARFRDEEGLEQLARDLRIPYPVPARLQILSLKGRRKRRSHATIRSGQ